MRDERGAILLLGVFLGVFLAAMLYYVVGLAEAIHAREGLQDAADAGAFSAAILHARGMNLVAFVNIVMAALVAVLVACRVIQGLCWVGIGVAAALAHPTFGASLAAVPPLQATSTKFEATYRGLQEPVMGTLRVLHGAQRMIGQAVPPVAVLDSVREAIRHHPPARFGVALPGAPRLPLEPDRFDVLCARAGETVADLVLWPLERLGLGPVATPLKRAAGAMTGSASSFFCGAGGASPPVYERQERASYPRSSAARECEERARVPDGPLEACEEARRELEAAQPGADGHCRPALQDCSTRGAYVRLAREARRQCRPREGFTPARFFLQRHTVAVEYTFRRSSGWRLTGMSRRDPRLSQELTTPCGPGGAVGEDWNLEVHPSGTVEDVQPLCSEEHTAPDRHGSDGERVTLEHEEVTQIFGCEVVETRRDEPFQGSSPIEGGEGREPHRMKNGVALGSDRFQIRAVAWGETPGGRSAEKAIAGATWGAENGREHRGAATDAVIRGAGDVLGRLALAQAEFYYDHDGGEASSEWLWNMKWTARLVRFRTREEPRQRDDSSSFDDLGLLTSDDVSSFGAVCRVANVPGCGELDGAVSVWERFLLH